MSTGYGSITNDPGGIRTRVSQMDNLVLSATQPQGLIKIIFNSDHYSTSKTIAHSIEYTSIHITEPCNAKPHCTLNFFRLPEPRLKEGAASATSQVARSPESAQDGTRNLHARPEPTPKPNAYLMARSTAGVKRRRRKEALLG